MGFKDLMLLPAAAVKKAIKSFLLQPFLQAVKNRMISENLNPGEIPARKSWVAVGMGVGRCGETTLKGVGIKTQTQD